MIKINKTVRYYLGIDVGKLNHQAILCDSEGKPMAQSFKFPSSFQGYKMLSKYLEQHVMNKFFPSEIKEAAGDEFSQIHAGLEATGAYWLSLYEQLKKLGIQVTVLNPLQVKSYRNEGIRGSKTDTVDALLIVKVLRFGDYKASDLPNGDLLALRQLTRLRLDLVKMTTSLKLRVISVFDTVFPEYQHLFTNIFGESSRAILDEAIDPEAFSSISTKKLTEILKRVSHGWFGENKANEIKQAASQSIGIRLGIDAFSLSAQILLAQITHLEDQVEKLNIEITGRLKVLKTTLTTIPGIGNVIAATIISEIGNFDRFAVEKDGAEKLVALAGIDPKMKDSGILKGKAVMSKRGSPYLRRAIRQAAFAASVRGKDPMLSGIYQKKISEGKHFEVALSHVENKMMHVVYSLLKSGKEYQPYGKA